MARTPNLQEQVQALDGGIGTLDLSDWTIVEVIGSDAEGWLNDLVTADVAGLAPGGSVRSLLLGPTGRIKADLVVHRREAGYLLIQSPGQPRRIDELLDPYVLSSDVLLRGAATAPVVRPSAGPWTVSSEGVGGVPVGAEAFESWRIRCGFPRFPVDLDEDSVPAEAGLDEIPTVDRSKGCYLGQESVAKIRNLGHPTRLVVALRADEPIAAGEVVLGGSAAVGRVTSVDGPGGFTSALARIRWEARELDLSTPEGVPLGRR